MNECFEAAGIIIQRSMSETPTPTRKVFSRERVITCILIVVFLSPLGIVGLAGLRFEKANQEWGALWWAEASFQNRPLKGLEFAEHNDRHLVCVRGCSGGRVWIMLDAQYDSLYKQRPPEESYDLAFEDYRKILKSGPFNATVMHCLQSHLTHEVPSP
jgi:hypothetical protein